MKEDGGNLTYWHYINTPMFMGKNLNALNQVSIESLRDLMAMESAKSLSL